MAHDPTSMAERIADDERQARRQRDADEAPALRQAIADRDAEIARLKDEIEGLRSQHNFDGFDIARLRAELAEARAEIGGLQCAMLVTPEQRGGYVTIADPPAEDPRIAALCYLVAGLDEIEPIPRTHHPDSKSVAAYRVIAPEDAAIWAERRSRMVTR